MRDLMKHFMGTSSHMIIAHLQYMKNLEETYKAEKELGLSHTKQGA